MSNDNELGSVPLFCPKCDNFMLFDEIDSVPVALCGSNCDTNTELDNQMATVITSITVKRSMQEFDIDMVNPQIIAKDPTVMSIIAECPNESCDSQLIKYIRGQENPGTKLYVCTKCEDSWIDETK
jgi:DNA-directed RNA polymerase subunit M/transcription elongation factor TFIIS